MMRLRSVLPVPAAAALLVAASLSVPCRAQGRPIDEGAFVITVKGKPARTESFKIARIDNGQIQATGQLIDGDGRISSSLVADSLGTPIRYLYSDKQRGVTMLTVGAVAAGHRLVLSSSDSRSNETTKEFPLVTGGTLFLEQSLVHQLYFVPLSRRSGPIEFIEPRTGRHEAGTLSGRGLEPVEIGGRSVTATHYSLVIGAAAQEFWVDSQGRVLRVEIPAQGITAVREELPR